MVAALGPLKKRNLTELMEIVSTGMIKKHFASADANQSSNQ